MSAHRTRADASRALAAFSVEVQTGQKRPAPPGAPLTLNELVEWYLDFASQERGLEHSTVVGYREVYDTGSVNRSATAEPNASSPPTWTEHDTMRRAGLSKSRMVNARAALSGAYKR